MWGPSFKSRRGDRLWLMRIFMVFFSPSRPMLFILSYLWNPFSDWNIFRNPTPLLDLVLLQAKTNKKKRLDCSETLHPFLYNISASKLNQLVYRYYLTVIVQYYYRKFVNIFTQKIKISNTSSAFRDTQLRPLPGEYVNQATTASIHVLIIHHHFITRIYRPTVWFTDSVLKWTTNNDIVLDIARFL
jgi:hypothetical protein